MRMGPIRMGGDRTSVNEIFSREWQGSEEVRLARAEARALSDTWGGPGLSRSTSVLLPKPVSVRCATSTHLSHTPPVFTAQIKTTLFLTRPASRLWTHRGLSISLLARAEFSVGRHVPDQQWLSGSITSARPAKVPVPLMLRASQTTSHLAWDLQSLPQLSRHPAREMIGTTQSRAVSFPTEATIPSIPD